MNNLVGFQNEKKYLLDNLKNNTLNNSIIISGQKGIGKRYFINTLISDYFRISIIHNRFNTWKHSSSQVHIS